MSKKLSFIFSAILFFFLSSWTSLVDGMKRPAAASDPVPQAENAHAFSFTKIEGGPLPLSDFKGRAVLVVNTASFCGFTHQYQALQELHELYEAQGFSVLGVPSNDFGAQEPGSSEEIKSFCEGAYGVTFPLTEKSVVRGSQAHPFYRWAQSRIGAKATPRWNFHKILIDPNGKPVTGFPSHISPDSKAVAKAIETALNTR